MVHQLQTLITEQHLTLYDVSWEHMETLASVLKEHGVRLTYLDGILELMVPSPEHEDYKRTLGRLIETYLRFQGIRFYDRGSPMLGAKESKSRGEPDESYNLEYKKPIPDLAIEVTITSGGIDKLKKSCRWGVPEVWFWENKRLAIYYLEAGVYKRADKSVLLPDLDVALLVHCARIEDQYDAVMTFEQSLQRYK